MNAPEDALAGILAEHVFLRPLEIADNRGARRAVCSCGFVLTGTRNEVLAGQPAHLAQVLAEWVAEREGEADMRGWERGRQWALKYDVAEREALVQRNIDLALQQTACSELVDGMTFVRDRMARAWREAAEECHREARWIAEQVMRGQRPDPLDRVLVLENILRARAEALGATESAGEGEDGGLGGRETERGCMGDSGGAE